MTAARAYALLAAPLLVPLLLFSARDSFGDEHAIIANALTFLVHHTLVPVNTSYPTLYSYLATPLVALGAVGAWLAGVGPSIRETVTRSLADDRWPLVIGPRLLSIALVAAAGWTVAVTARRRYGQPAALVAAATLLASHAILVEGTFGLPDALVLFLCAVCFGLLVRQAETGDDRLLRWAAGSAGFATAAKYNAVCATVPIAVVLLRQLFAAVPSGRAAVLRELGWCASAFTLAFLAGTPGWLLAPRLFAAGLSFELEHARAGHLGTTGLPVLGQLELLARDAPLVLVLGAGGLWVGLRGRERRTTVLAALSAGGGLLLAATSHKQSIQYLFPTFPALCDAAAAAVAYLSASRAKAGLVAIGLALGVCAGANLEAGLRTALHRSTTRVARDWIESHVPAGTRVALEDNYVPRLYSSEALAKLASDSLKGSPAVATWLLGRHKLYALEQIPANAASLLAAGGPEVVVTSEQAYDRFFSSGLFTSRPPPPGSPLSRQYVVMRDFYRQLFNSPDWEQVLDVPSGNGPRTRVFARRAGQGAFWYTRTQSTSSACGNAASSMP